MHRIKPKSDRNDIFKYNYRVKSELIEHTCSTSDRMGAVASLTLERGRALGWGVSEDVRCMMSDVRREP